MEHEVTATARGLGTARAFHPSEMDNPAPIWPSVRASLPILAPDPGDGRLRYAVTYRGKATRAIEVDDTTMLARGLLRLLCVQSMTAPVAYDAGRMLAHVCRAAVAAAGRKELSGFLRAARRAEVPRDTPSDRTRRARQSALAQWRALWSPAPPPLPLDTARHLADFAEQCGADALEWLRARDAAGTRVSFCRAYRCVVGVLPQYQVGMLGQTCPVRALIPPPAWRRR